MKFTRREAIGVLTGGVLAGLTADLGLPAAWGQTMPTPDIAPGPFQGTRASLQAFKVPDWYRDAKFGIWAHWGPQSAAEYGDWFARNMYIPGQPQYDYHLKTYGHPSKSGFKDVISTWKADKFDAEYLISLYKKAGAKYFCSMAVHHDGFDLWNSKYQPRWNAVASGPKKDIVTMWRDAARNAGLKFALSEHLSNSFAWLAPSHLSDKTGPLAGVPYDGADPQWADLYHDYSKMPDNFAQSIARNAMGRINNDAWKLNYFQRMIDLIDQHQPDLLYTDGGIPYGDLGLNIVAHLYNTSAARNNGTCQALYTSKTRSEAAAGICILDVERGLVNDIWPAPWQTDTCIGSWHYDKRIYEGDKYKTPKTVVDMLCDIVSRNGNLQLNFPLPNNGMLDDKELKVLDGITQWMAVNSDGIYGSRPYKIFGDGPAANAPATTRRFNESARKEMTAEDVRYTTNGDTLYAFVMGWPGKEAAVPSLATNARQGVGKIVNVELLGAGKVPFTQDETGLKVQLPEKQPSDHAITLKIMGALDKA
ncbi:MAG: alpha-L-fucosidase [Planctomycetota bacterium]|nr:alpha-L-fucosidase [Planctomycetota bacterium]